jgi:hypothetical protein
LIRPARRAYGGKLSFLPPYPDFNRNEHVFAKMCARLGKDDARNVNQAGDKIRASAIAPFPRNAPTTSKTANTLQPETITL